MTRILLFLATNGAILIVAGIVFSIFERSTLDPSGQSLNLTALLVFSAIIGFSGSLVSLFLSKSMAKRSMGVHVIEQPRAAHEQWLLATVRRLAEQAGIGMPEVGIWQGAEMNAFATGWNRDQALVAVSTGLLESMRREEVEAVLAHEIAHVANGDMVTLTLIQGVVNTFVVFAARVVGQVVDRAVFRTERGHGPGYWLVVMVMQMVFSVLASIIVMWFSRYREFRADAGGARLAGRDNMIRALDRLRGGGEPLPDQMAAFGVSGATLGSGLRKLFMTHPPLEERIAALRSAA